MVEYEVVIPFIATYERALEIKKKIESENINLIVTIRRVDNSRK